VNNSAETIRRLDDAYRNGNDPAMEVIEHFHGNPQPTILLHSQRMRPNATPVNNPALLRELPQDAWYGVPMAPDARQDGSTDSVEAHTDRALHALSLIPDIRRLTLSIDPYQRTHEQSVDYLTDVLAKLPPEQTARLEAMSVHDIVRFTRDEQAWEKMIAALNKEKFDTLRELHLEFNGNKPAQERMAISNGLRSLESLWLDEFRGQSPEVVKRSPFVKALILSREIGMDVLPGLKEIDGCAVETLGIQPVSRVKDDKPMHPPVTKLTGTKQVAGHDAPPVAMGEAAK
jgi:hypothetical protein